MTPHVFFEIELVSQQSCVSNRAGNVVMYNRIVDDAKNGIKAKTRAQIYAHKIKVKPNRKIL